MGKTYELNERANIIGEKIFSALYNLGDDMGIDKDDWKKSSEVILRKLAKPDQFFVCTEEDLELETTRDYFFVSVNKEAVDRLFEDLRDQIRKYYEENEDKRQENGRKTKYISVMYIVQDLETRVCVDDCLGNNKENKAKKEQLRNELRKSLKVKVSIDFIPIVVKKSRGAVVELQGMERYSMIQEPPLENNINFSRKLEETKKTGYVTSVPLLEVIKMYNVVGDELFDKNVRYGLNEQLGVNQAIEQTLEKEPEEFWYRNNGITILVKSDTFEMEFQNKVQFAKEDNFSIINGAQTVTVSANFYYKLLAKCQKNKSNLELENQIQRLNKAKVLLRIICIPD